MRDQLERAMWHPVSDESRRTHLQAIELELAEPSLSRSHRPRRINRRSLVLVSAIAVATLSGAALAAESSVPGDLLYPIKQVTEEVRSWFDSDVPATHRVDELDRVIERDAPPSEIEERLNDARFQVDQLDADHPLRDQLSDLERDLQLRPNDAVDGARDDVAPPTTVAPDVVPGGDRTDTTVPVDEAVRDDPPPTTSPPAADVPTTEPPPSSPVDQPPPTGGDRGDEPPGDG